jgi:anthranilate synthase component 2
MKVLIIDNYDSFTFNLYQYIGEILKEKGENFIVDVVRNDKISLEDIKKANYDRIIISPGPGEPSDKAYFGICADVITKIGKKTPVLGVCLGMQGIAYYFGGKVVRATVPMHGKTSMITHDKKGVFQGLPQDLEVMRYHSLVADRNSLPDVLEITAVAISCHPEQAEPNGELACLTGAKRRISRDSSVASLLQKDNALEVMGIRHKKYPIEGIQFHPESFATEGGKRILENFLFQK